MYCEFQTTPTIQRLLRCGMKNFKLPSEVAQDTDTSGYQLSDLQDIEFQWENPDLKMDAVFRPNVKTLFSSPKFNDFEKGSLSENPLLIDEQQAK